MLKLPEVTIAGTPVLLTRIEIFFKRVDQGPQYVRQILDSIEIRRHHKRPGLVGQHGVWATRGIKEGTILGACILWLHFMSLLCPYRVSLLGSYGGRLMTDEAFDKRWTISNPVNLMAHFYVWDVQGVRSNRAVRKREHSLLAPESSS